ncbi:MAG: biopolymer transporter ExbD [Phycisphaerae bacterium]|jgi:biopolymer transport protein ExbD|nr:biopolymer transporter ExbD [Phycisphaerae bacterium]
MAKNQVYKKNSSGSVEFNMTPMIDCTFQLIIFFILSATVLSDALADLELHRPYRSQASDDKELNKLPNRIIVNVLSEETDKKELDSGLSATAKEYMINGKSIRINDMDGLIERIRQGAIKAQDEHYKEFFVEVRADHRVSFRAVQGVLKAAASASIRGVETKMNITALTYK